MQNPATSALSYGYDDALEDILGRGARTAAALGFGYRRLWATLVDATGGKRFRPALFTMTYRAWGGTDERAAAVVAAAIELLHTAFVVHDDVIDREDVRRGRPNVSGSHVDQARGIGVDERRAIEYGAAAGILAGDLALAAALRAVATCPAPRATVLHLLDLFDSALHTSAAGELADVRMSLGVDSAAVSETLTVEERKTGEYSFSLPLQAGAVLAGAPAGAVESAGNVGRCLGIAYQLVDDIDGVFGDPDVTGKSSLSDLRSGKQTPLMAHARTTASWPAIAAYVGRPDLTDAQASRVRTLLTDCGSRTFVQDLVHDHVRAAAALCEQSAMPPALVSWIDAMSADLVRRAA
jgi:geranylgeranyl diphosphate synthase type II